MNASPQNKKATIFLIPTVLHDDERALQAIPAYILNAVQQCDVFFAENEKTARRYFKKLWKEMVIDNYAWYTIHKAEDEVANHFRTCIQQAKHIGIVSEAGCPGIADPGQKLVHLAQEMHAEVVPLVGPNSILLSLMASGMNGQQFQFNGYLPIDEHERKKALKELEDYSSKKNCTQIFIETPYRNNQLLKTMMQTCKKETQICIAANITAASESIITKTVKEWEKNLPDLHKQPVIFLLYAGN